MILGKLIIIRKNCLISDLKKDEKYDTKQNKEGKQRLSQ